jgi:hypothetical protein
MLTIVRFSPRHTKAFCFVVSAQFRDCGKNESGPVIGCGSGALSPEANYFLPPSKEMK